MKIPVYNPQINASTVQYNAVADIRTNTLGEIADGLQQYGKFREAQLEEERQTERFKADSAIKYELEDAHSKMLDAIQNGGAYADAEAKYQKTFDETLAKYMPMMGDDPNITERARAEYQRYGLGHTVQLRNAIQQRRKGDAIDATNLRVQQSDERMMRAMIAGDQKAVDAELAAQASIYAGATSVGAITKDEATFKIQQRVSNMRGKQALYLAQNDPRAAKQALESAYAKKEIMAEDYIAASATVNKAIEEIGSYESVKNYITDPTNNKRPNKQSIDVGFNYVLQKSKDMDKAGFENEVLKYSISAGAVPQQIMNQVGAYFSQTAEEAKPEAVMQMARIVSEVSKRDQTFLDGRKFDKNDIAIANLMVSRVAAGMTEVEAVRSVLRQKNDKNASDLFTSAQNDIITKIRKEEVSVSGIGVADYVDAYATQRMLGATDSEAKTYAENVIEKTIGEFNGVTVRNPATKIPDPTMQGAVFSEKEWNKSVDDLIGLEWIKSNFGTEAKPLITADRETMRLIMAGQQPTFPLAIHYGGENPDNFMIPRDQNGMPIRIRMRKQAKRVIDNSKYNTNIMPLYGVTPWMIQ